VLYCDAVLEPLRPDVLVETAAAHGVGVRELGPATAFGGHWHAYMAAKQPSPVTGAEAMGVFLASASSRRQSRDTDNLAASPWRNATRSSPGSRPRHTALSGLQPDEMLKMITQQPRCPHMLLTPITCTLMAASAPPGSNGVSTPLITRPRNTSMAALS